MSIVEIKQLHDHIDGLVQERRNSIANALELRLSCINPSISSPSTKGDWDSAYRAQSIIDMMTDDDLAP